MIAYHTTAHFVHDAATGLPLPDLARFGRIQYLKQLNKAGRWVLRKNERMQGQP
jgi:hypothetical protein